MEAGWLADWLARHVRAHEKLRLASHCGLCLCCEAGGQGLLVACIGSIWSPRALLGQGQLCISAGRHEMLIPQV